MLLDMTCCWKAREELWWWWALTFCDVLGRFVLDEGLFVARWLIAITPILSSRGSIVKKNWNPQNSWKLRRESVKNDLKLFLQSKFFANPAANLPSCFQNNLLQIPSLLRTNCKKGLRSFAFAVLLMTKTWNARPKNHQIEPQFQSFLLNWPKICSKHALRELRES